MHFRSHRPTTVQQSIKGKSLKGINYVSFICLLMVLFSCNNAEKQSAKGLDSLPAIDEVGAANMPETIAPVKAPFDMPEMIKPTFPNLSVNIQSNGAKPGKKISKVIQQTINQVSSKGGGTVIIPKGKWWTGRISLKSNINLHLEEGAELYFSGDVKDYQPAVFTRNEGIELMSLGACIYANGQDNIAVTGKGKIFGPEQGGTVRSQVMDSIVIEDFVSYKTPVKQRVYEGSNGGYIFLPMLISPINCTHVYIEGVSLANTAFWNIVPIYCDGVIIRGVTVESVGIPRGDGMDIESSKNVLVEYCTLSCGDDCFTIKSGRGEDGLRVNKPTENVVVRYCLAKKGHGGVTCGSETAGMIRNLYVHDCVFDKTNVGIRFKTRRPRGGGGENLYYQNIRMNQTGKAFQWDMLGGRQYVGDLADRLPARPVGRLTPVYRDITIRNIIVENSSQFVKIKAIPESPLSNVLFENIQVKTEKLFTASDVDSFTVHNAVIESKDSLISLLDTRNLTFDNVDFKVTGDSVLVDVKGPNAGPITFKNCKPIRPKGWPTGTWTK